MIAYVPARAAGCVRGKICYENPESTEQLKEASASPRRLPVTAAKRSDDLFDSDTQLCVRQEAFGGLDIGIAEARFTRGGRA